MERGCISSGHNPETLTSVPLLLAFLLKLVRFFFRFEAFREFCRERRKQLSSEANSPGALPCRTMWKMIRSTCCLTACFSCFDTSKPPFMGKPQTATSQVLQSERLTPHHTEKQGIRSLEALMDSHNNTCYTCQPSQ